MKTRIAILESTLGTLAAEFNASGAVCRLEFVETDIDEHLAQRASACGHALDRDQAAGQVLQRELDEYFAGERRVFDHAVELEGTDFQREIWSALTQIPFGEVWSYGQLARHVGRAGASRAVGSANGANPVPILVPCHRVIAADGGLGGFSAGLDRKRALLELEGADAPLFRTSTV